MRQAAPATGTSSAWGNRRLLILPVRGSVLRQERFVPYSAADSFSCCVSAAFPQCPAERGPVRVLARASRAPRRSGRGHAHSSLRVVEHFVESGAFDAVPWATRSQPTTTLTAHVALAARRIGGSCSSTATRFARVAPRGPSISIGPYAARCAVRRDAQWSMTSSDARYGAHELRTHSQSHRSSPIMCAGVDSFLRCDSVPRRTDGRAFYPL